MTANEEEAPPQGVLREDATPVFRCVHCMAPSSSMYRFYGSEIKLTLCAKCGQNVDPYVERDWLLVAMDCILLREEAFRHVLCNIYSNNARTTKNASSSWKNYHVWRIALAMQTYMLLQEEYRSRANAMNGGHDNSMLLFSLLSGYLSRAHDDDDDDVITPSIASCLITVYIGNSAFLLGLQIGKAWLLSTSPQSPAATPTAITIQRHNVIHTERTAMAMPLLFHILTCLVMIWESTSMVRQLASILVLYYQYLAMTVVLQLESRNNSKSPAMAVRPSKRQCLGVFLVAILCRSLAWKLLGAVYHLLHSLAPEGGLPSAAATNSVPCILELNVLRIILSTTTLQMKGVPVWAQNGSFCLA